MRGFVWWTAVLAWGGNVVWASYHGALFAAIVYCLCFAFTFKDALELSCKTE